MRSVLLIIALGLTFIGEAQISKGNEQLTQAVDQLYVQTMPAIINDLQIEKELHARAANRAPHFAIPIAVDLNPNNAGQWEFVDKKAIWRLVIESPSAHSLNLGFTKFFLPSTSSLFIYDYHNQEQVRPFVSSDNDEHEQMWTPILSSDKIVIEINIDKADMEALQLQLSFVNHDFMDIQKSLSDACHIDVGCGAENGYPGIDEYRDQVRSVGMYTIGGTSVCTGFLINNTREDCRPYFMTASHCNLTASNASTMVAYWNYQNSYCRQPGSNNSAADGDGVLSNFNSGAIFRAGWQDSDFTLVELDDEVPKEADAYFCGWDISNNSPERGVVIHHPNLEEKRISFKYGALYNGQWGQETNPIANGNHFIVDSWDLGSTEDGSSGAPLFNRQGLVVGQLHGGLASCENQGYDAFGRLFSSWTGGGEASNRLKDWLDPDNTGVLTMQGKNCVFNIQLSENDFSVCSNQGFFEILVDVDDSFQGPVELVFEALPEGAFAFFDQDIVQPGQVAKLTVSNLQELLPGNYTFDIVAKDLSSTVRVPLLFEIFSQIEMGPQLYFPEPMSSVDIEKTPLVWEEFDRASFYRIQIAEDTAFTENVMEKAAINSNFSWDTPLEVNTNYFWRVKAVNTCGESEWSFVNQFTSIEVTCWTGEELQDLIIGDQEPSTIFSTLRMDTPGSVVSVVLKNIKGEHSFVSDLRMSIISPKGTEVVLIDGQCSASTNFDLGFSDEGQSEISCPLTNSNLFQPLESLAKFNGESAIGDWTLKIEDKNNFDGGLLQEWYLDICVAPAIDYSLSAEIQSLNICVNESFTIPLILGASFDPSTPLEYVSNIPNLAQVTVVEGVINLQINPSEMAPPGNYPVQISVTDDSGNSSIYALSLVVVRPPLEFDLISPANGNPEVEMNSSLEWSTSNFAMEYIIEFSNSLDFSTIQIIDTIDAKIYTLDDRFESGLTYYWRVSATNRCGSLVSPSFAFTMEMTNGLDQLSPDLLGIHPNPAHDVLYISRESSSLQEDLNISIYSIDGKLYYNGQLPSDKAIISISHWPKGIYILSAEFQDQVQMSRIVVQ